MVFSSLTFLLYFLPLSLAGYYILPKAVKNYWLLIVSLLFYFWGAHSFLWVMVISIIFNYLCALAISSLKNNRLRKAVLAVSIILNLAILFYNKYMNLTTGLLNKYWNDSITVTEIALPIGISFFTFQAMSYVIDVYRKDTPVQKNPYYLGLYISFFPQLIAGPIVRYRTIAEQIEDRKTTVKQFCNGVTRFMGGFSQKILLANTMSVIADKAFATCSSDKYAMSVSFAWIGAIAYSLQILFDFSGYSSMAIGLGKMFGFEFMENFNYPYMANSITDFWRRWHISLSQWFRDYVYIPLGGSRVDKKWKLFRNLLVTWLLTGIWHGANFTFLCWGIWYFVLLCFEKITNLGKKTLSLPLAVIYRIATLICIVLGWVVFRAEGLHQAGNYVGIMFKAFKNPLIDNYAIRYLSDYKIVFLIAFFFCTPVLRKIQDYAESKFQLGWLVSFIYDIGLVGCVVLSISCLVMGANNPFIYFNF